MENENYGFFVPLIGAFLCILVSFVAVIGGLVLAVVSGVAGLNTGQRARTVLHKAEIVLDRELEKDD